MTLQTPSFYKWLHAEPVVQCKSSAVGWDLKWVSPSIVAFLIMILNQSVRVTCDHWAAVHIDFEVAAIAWPKHVINNWCCMNVFAGSSVLRTETKNLSACSKNFSVVSQNLGTGGRLETHFLLDLKTRKYTATFVHHSRAPNEHTMDKFSTKPLFTFIQEGLQMLTLLDFCIFIV